MPVLRPFHLQEWIEAHRHLLKPPVGNRQIYQLNDDFIVMIVGGPNARRDYHYNEGEELFYQIEGDIVLKIIEDGKPVDIPIRQGEIFLLPPRIPHSPRRPANTIGLVVERYRRQGEQDGFLWYCENCDHQLHEHYAVVTDIVTQLPPIMSAFYDSEERRTCKKCGTVMERP